MAYSQPDHCTRYSAAHRTRSDEAGCASDDILAGSAPWRTAITARMLLNHTSGIPNDPIDWFVTEEDQAYSRDMAPKKMLRDHPNLNFEPGSKYGYSTLPTGLWKRPSEAVSGQSFVNYVRAHLWSSRSSLQNASFTLSPRPCSNRSYPKVFLSNFLFYLISPSAY
jgi:CubicO group peptidase (beta-lactamase class C family)